MFRKYLMDGLEPNQGAINFSELLDAPAGKHGFLRGRDGGLYFEDGVKLRVVGTSMVGSGCVPNHDTAEIVAERIASSGLNLVRMHYADGMCDVGEEPGSEMRLIDYSQSNSRNLNEEALERLDYFIYQLKQRGVYVQLDTFVGRNWMPEGDELDYPDTFASNWAPKQCNIFNRRMIELQKEYQTKLLTHMNRYTGLRYVDDPAIAIVQMMNENTLLWDFGANFNIDTIGPGYRRELQEKWRLWLKKKYGTNEALIEAWTDLNGVCCKQEVEHLDFAVQIPSEPYHSYDVFGAEHDAPQKSNLAQPRMSDFVAFLIDTENAFTAEILQHLRSIGVKCGINTTNLIRGAAHVYTSTRNCDVQEHDAYYNHPYCGFAPPAKVSSKPMVEIDPRGAFTGQFTSNNLITQLANGQVDGIPMVVAEWNDVSPTPFDADAMLEMTAYGSLQDWDGMCNFQYNGDADISGLKRKLLYFYFTMYNDPAKWGQIGISSYVFQKELIRKARNTIYMCYTADDLRANLNDSSMIPFATLPFISRVVTRFSDNDRFDAGENELAISGGFTPTGDFTEASHAVVFSDSPYADLHHHAMGREEYLARHREANALPYYGIGCIGDRRLVIDEGRTVSHNAYAYGDAVSDAMRRWGLLESDQGIINGKYFNSDTGELQICPREGTFRVNTEQFAAFAGHPDGTIKVGNAEFDISNRIMAISMLSRDGKPLEESDYILLTAIGETTNEGMRFEKEWLMDLGHEPVLVDQIDGKMVLRNAKKSLKIYALKPNGERAEELEVTFNGNDAVVALATKECAIHYEIRS